ncbi:SRPBCC family protein [Acinetobacter sp. CWB-B33]
MYIIENKMEIQCSAQALFNYVTQPWLWHEWHPNSISATESSNGLKVGDTFLEMIRLKPLDPLPVIFNRETSYTVLVSQPDTQWIVEGKTNNGALRIQYDFEQISENRVLFKRTLSFKVEGHLRVMSYFLVKNMKKTSVIALDNLKRKLSDA